MSLASHQKIIDEIIEKSRISDRRRAFHIVRSADKPEDVPAVMYNAFQPETYVQPHMHPEEKGKEIWIPYQGNILAILFDLEGNVEEFYPMSKFGTTFLEIPAQTYHTAIATVEDSVICELYLDIYNPETYKKFAEWEGVPPEKDANQDPKKLKRLHEKYLEDLFARLR